jgi:hypothetical protein
VVSRRDSWSAAAGCRLQTADCGHVAPPRDDTVSSEERGEVGGKASRRWEMSELEKESCDVDCAFPTAS